MRYLNMNRLLASFAALVLIGACACSPATPPPAAQVTQTVISGGLPDFTPIVDEVMPAVVTIFVTVPRKEEPGLDSIIPFFFGAPPKGGPKGEPNDPPPFFFEAPPGTHLPKGMPDLAPGFPKT